VREIIVLALVAVVGVRLLQHRLPRSVLRALFAMGVLVPFAALFYAIWLLWEEWIGPQELALFVALYVLTGLGITLGFHRFLTHRSFETGPLLKVILLAFGSMANQGRCISWAAYHLKHHALSDRDGDPHSPLDGLLHSYCGWILRGTPADRERYCKRLLEDRVVLFMDRTAPVWVLLGLLGPYLVAGWRGLLWGGLARIGFTNHVVFTVNSIGHTYGSQPFDTGDRSRNNAFLAALAFGDGWHNNHHAFPAMASHGMTRREFDPTGLVIRALARLGLVWNVKGPPSPRAVGRRLRMEIPAPERGVPT
jgi:stearoyl-CoA desaturase (delta-9 desaturase)